MKTMGKKWSVLGLLLTVLVMMTTGCASGEKAGEVFPDFTGDQNMLFSQPTMFEYQYFMGFGMDGMLTQFSVKKDYDVDYSSSK